MTYPEYLIEDTLKIIKEMSGQPNSNEQEKIAFVAMRDPTGFVRCVTEPFRHHDIIHIMHEEGCTQEMIARSDQGFWTTKNRFVDRKEARIIAVAANQIVREFDGGETKLYSEHLW